MAVGVFFRTEQEDKKQAEEILSSLGITPTTALRMFYRQIVVEKGLPFRPSTVPMSCPLPNVDTMTIQAFEAELNRGMDDVQADRVKSAAEVFSIIRRGRRHV